MIQAIVADDIIQVKILSPISGSFKEDVEMIKALPGRRYRDGFWYVPYEQKYNLIDIFGENITWIGEINAPKEEIVSPYQGITTILSDIDLTRFKRTPFPYQIVGSSFLINNKTAMVADEPGVGKTLQAIVGVDYLYNKGLINKSLIITPSSVKYQWGSEIEKFTNLPYIVIDGTPKKREQQFNTEVLFYLINYELVRQDFDLQLIKKHNFNLITLDEAHRIKDYNALISRQLRQLDAEYKWLLTGTPVQNKYEELFSLYAFMNKNILGSWTEFKKQHLIIGNKYGRRGVVLDYKHAEIFKQKTSPHMIRRTIEEVLPDMPPLVITNHLVELTDEQYKLHDLVLADMLKALKNLGKVKDLALLQTKEDQVMGYRILLQEICDSPQLLTMSESRMASKYEINSTISPKLNELKSILVERLANKPDLKVVIFTQFERMQRLVAHHLQDLGEYTLVSGSLKAFQKQASIDRFKYDPDVRFLICTDSANTGLNLQEASLLINVDIPWNPAILTQRIGRIRRADSKHDLLQVINLIALFGIDERILSSIYDKQDMVSYLLDKTEVDKEVTALLTQKVLDQIMNEKENK